MHTSTGVVTVPLPWLPLSALECGERGGRWKVEEGGGADTYEATDAIRKTHAPLSPTSQAEIG